MGKVVRIQDLVVCLISGQIAFSLNFWGKLSDANDQQVSCFQQPAPAEC